MRRIFAIAMIAGITACSPTFEEPTDVGKDTEAATVAPDFYAMGPGMYDIEGGEGVVYATSELRTDGTYVDSAGDKQVGNGTWTADGPTVCFDPEGDGENQKERCWTNSPLNEDGSFTTTRDDGSESYTVRPRQTN